MGIDISGFVEVNYDSGSDLASEWTGLITIIPLIKICDVDAYFIFDIGRGAPYKDAIASERGLPTDVSPEVLDCLESYSEFGVFGVTYLTYKEVVDFGLVERLEGDQWNTVFLLMKVLHETHIHNAENIRVVVWAYW